MEEAAEMAKADKAERNIAFCNLPGKCYVLRDFKEQLESSDYFRMALTQMKSFLKKVESITLSELHSSSTFMPTSSNSLLAGSGMISVPYDPIWC